MNLPLASSDPDLSQVLYQAAFWLIGVVIILAVALAIAKYIDGWKLEGEFAELEDWNMALHDGWRAKASSREFERHRRGCRRCRGDAFGQLDFDLPEGVEAHSLSELRESKARQKAEWKAKRKARLPELPVQD